MPLALEPYHAGHGGSGCAEPALIQGISDPGALTAGTIERTDKVAGSTATAWPGWDGGSCVAATGAYIHNEVADTGLAEARTEISPALNRHRIGAGGPGISVHSEIHPCIYGLGAKIRHQRRRIQRSRRAAQIIRRMRAADAGVGIAAGNRQRNRTGLRRAYDQVQALVRCIDEPGCESCLLYTSPSPRDGLLSRMPSSA